MSFSLRAKEKQINTVIKIQRGTVTDLIHGTEMKEKKRTCKKFSSQLAETAHLRS